MGDIVRLRFTGRSPPGIESISAREGSFILKFTAPVDRREAVKPGDIRSLAAPATGPAATPHPTAASTS